MPQVLTFVRGYETNTPMFSQVGDPLVIWKVRVESAYRKNDPYYIHGKAPAYDRETYELVYTGNEGSVVMVTYREFTNDLARPSFYLNLRYDLKNSPIIKYKEFTIKVDSVSGSKIYFMVTDEPKLWKVSAPDSLS